MSSATSTTVTLNDLTTDMIMARSPQQQQYPNLREIVPFGILSDHMITWQHQ